MPETFIREALTSISRLTGLQHLESQVIEAHRAILRPDLNVRGIESHLAEKL